MKIRAILGAVLMLLGAYLFLNQGGSYGTGDIFAYFWPSLFVIPLGLFFHWMYFKMIGRKGVGLLIPGGVLLIAGMVCQVAMLFDSWEYMWPGFIFAPAVGLFEFYWFGGRNKWLLIPINILTVLSVLFFIIFTAGALLGKISGQPIIAVAILLVGAFLLIGRKKEI
ncbi:hypothetical protein [Paenibacillus ginsengarvi]|uniref:DUF5668 domain-containing protein n=1 Tax=Paenibacillus ginsengarvi TaxID=400777 RepID=A0A3B0C7F3_9BACL|nr:hypothetical protein [Paenibacillus ginsengarvi]RKN80518.1 hypothetical protein D7M11_20475 [Paenibacillus ginsengarvi]